MKEEPILFTLADARVELNKIDCLRMGHRYQVVTSNLNMPVEIQCQRCGCHWKVAT